MIRIFYECYYFDSKAFNFLKEVGESYLCELTLRNLHSIVIKLKAKRRN